MTTLLFVLNKIRGHSIDYKEFESERPTPNITTVTIPVRFVYPYTQRSLAETGVSVLAHGQIIRFLRSICICCFPLRDSRPTCAGNKEFANAALSCGINLCCLEISSPRGFHALVRCNHWAANAQSSKRCYRLSRLSYAPRELQMANAFTYVEFDKTTTPFRPKSPNFDGSSNIRLVHYGYTSTTSSSMD